MNVTPEFKPDSMGVVSSIFLVALLICATTYTSWIASELGPLATFHMTHGIKSTWSGVSGMTGSIITGILSLRGFGLNALAALLGSMSLSLAAINGELWKPSVAIILGTTWLITAIYFLRPRFDGNAFKTFVWVWGLTTASSFSQSIIYKTFFDHTYPILGVLVLKAIVFGFGGLVILAILPRKNEEYVI